MSGRTLYSSGEVLQAIRKMKSMPRLETTQLLTARDVIDTARENIEELVRMGYRKDAILNIFHESGVKIPENTFNAYFRVIAKSMKQAAKDEKTTLHVVDSPAGTADDLSCAGAAP